MSALSAFLITVCVGLATGIGAGVAFFTRKENSLFLSVCMGFSAGVMIYLSFMEMLPAATEATANPIVTALGFFGGALSIGLIDKLIPNNENPHEFFHKQSDLRRLRSVRTKKHLLRVGVLTAGAITLHNFPEGFATFMSLLYHSDIGISMAIAVALHNIPEGIAVSVPVFYATGSRLKAFVFSFASGLSEPLGALIGYLLLKPFLSNAVMGCVFGIIAGIMVYIALDELLPAARQYGRHHLAIFSVFTGMAVMSVLLIFL